MRQLTAILTLALLVALGLKVTAQTDTEKVLKAEKVAFLTKKLELTQDEAKKFWPLYDEYWGKKIDILNNRYNLAEDFIKKINNLNEKEAIDYANRYIESQKLEVELMDEFNKRFLGILPPKKVMLLYQSNYEFKNYLLQKVKETKK